MTSLGLLTSFLAQVQQRWPIARALANQPKLILADEPNASLDTIRGKKVMEMLKKIAKENQSAVIVVTHDVRMIEGFDYVYHLKDGRRVMISSWLTKETRSTRSRPL